MVLFALVALLVLRRGEAVQKCCDQFESLDSQNSCVPSDHQWFYMNFTYGIPDCNYTVSYAGESASASCIDYVLDIGSYKMFECQNSENKFQVPSINYVKKCCPLKRTYDSVQQSCWGENGLDIEWPNDFFNVILAGFKGVVDVNIGAPVCSENYVLADYFLPLNQVRREESESVVLQIEDSPEIKFNPDDVCIDLTEKPEFLVVRACILADLACYPDGPMTCIRKCCPDGKSFIGKDCKTSNAPITPLDIYNDENSLENYSSLAYFFNFPPQCDSKFVINSPITIYKTHFVLHDSEESSEHATWDNYCIEHVSDETEGVQLFGCFGDEEDSGSLVFILNSSFMPISCFFLFLTLIVYSCIPALRNLHGKTLMCHLSCLLLGYCCLTYIQSHYTDVEGFHCKLFALLNLFAFLGAFAWLNVIGFDIWWTFGSMRTVASRKGQDRKRFIFYSVYSWSIPTFFTLAAFLADNCFLVPEIIRPKLGELSCFIAKENALPYFLYFKGFQIFVAITNIFFFIMTAIHCSRVKSELHRLAHKNLAERRFKADKKKLTMNFKLFVVMGISWVLEWISEYDNSFIWVIADLMNALQGVLIFMIFVVKRKVLKAFSRRVKEVVCHVKPKQHRPSTSTMFTVLSSESKTPFPLKKSTSDSKLSVGCPSPKRLHQRCLSSTFSNQLTVSNHLTPTI